MSKFDIFNHIAISAGAGSGKTYTLSRRYINILVGFNLFFEDKVTPFDESTLQSCSPTEIVTITYTEAGALEMKSRIFGLIQKVLAYSNNKLDVNDGDYTSIKAAFDPIENSPIVIEHIQRSLNQALQELPSAIISTIHSYCLDMIDQYGDYLKLDAKPSIIEDDEKVILFSEVYRETLNKNQELVEEIDQTISLYKLSKIAQKYSFNAQFRDAFDKYAIALKDDGKVLQRAWQAQKILPNRELIVEGLESAIEMALADAKKGQYCDALFNNVQVVLDGAGEWMAYEGQLRASKKLPQEILDPVKGLRDLLNTLKGTLVDPEKESLYKEILLKIHSLFSAMYQRFNDKLHLEGYTDFETILQHANELLDYDIDIPTKYFMVDEFQDTNAFQWGIITKAAAKNNANIFIVGDEKQSIFAFQGADVSVFAKAKQEIEANEISMGVNRRSDKSIISMVNQVFSRSMHPEEVILHTPLENIGNTQVDEIIGQMNKYLNERPILNDFEALYEPLSTPEGRAQGSVSILVTPVDQSIDECDEECHEAEQEMRSIASFIHEVVTGSEYPKVKQAYDKGEKAVAVLFDTRKQMLLLKEKLLQLGLKAKVSDSGNLYDTKEVNDIYIVLKLLLRLPMMDFTELNKRDKYIFVGALRSNILRCDGDTIDNILQNGKLPDICNKWLKEMEYITPSKLIENIVNDSKLLHVYRYLEGYEQRAANIEKLINMAYDFETTKGSSLNAYVYELENCIHNEDISEDEAFVIEDGVGSIEIRTMHSSKGLEWSMVILGSTNRSFMGMQPSEDLVFDTFNGQELVGFGVGDYKPLVYDFIKERTKLKHLAERKRLLYVGMTRPEHHLVISAAINDYGNGPKLCYNCGNNNYFSLINQSLELDIEALYLKTAQSTDEINIVYPLEWKGQETQVLEVEVVDPVALQVLDFNGTSYVKPSGEAAALDFLADEEFDAGSAGTVVHRIIEECWEFLEEDDHCFIKWFDEYNVPSRWQERIKALAKAFIKSKHYAKIKNWAEAYFEHTYSIIDNEDNHVNGSIDLLYYDEEKNGWVIVDFKTTALNGMDEDEAMVHHGYDIQLDHYAAYVESVMGEGSVVSKDVCWLDKLASRHNIV